MRLLEHQRKDGMENSDVKETSFCRKTRYILVFGRLSCPAICSIQMSLSLNYSEKS